MSFKPSSKVLLAARPRARHHRGMSDAPKRPQTVKKHRFTYRQQYGVIAICKDERDQRRTYNRLLKQGLKLKVVTV